jgi:two-component system cell cycle sensor histidine kinase/response regulator CckA
VLTGFSIRKKIIFAFLVLVVIMSCVFAVTSYLRIIKTMHHEIEKHGVDVSKTFSQMVTPYIFESDYMTIIDNTDKLIENSDICMVAILDIHGVPWLTTQEEYARASTSTPFYQNIIKNKTIGYRNVVQGGNKSLELVTPITALGEVRYLLKMVISLESIEKEAVARIREAIVISCIMIVVAAILGAFLGRLLIEPLKNLVRGTNEIAKGNFGHRITITSGDEIGGLSKSFNLMTSNLEKELSARKQVEKDLQKHKSQLEEIVLARTAELTQTNVRILEEIKEHRKTVIALRQSEERYKRFSEVTIDGIIFQNQEGIVDINSTFTELFGYSREEIKGKTLAETIRLPEYIDCISTGFIETVGIHKNGTAIHIEMLNRVLGDNSKYLAVTSVRNINDRKLLETQLHQAQKMESIGLIAGGVAHDLNNILTSMVGYPEYLLLDLPGDSALREPIEAIRESGIRAAEVVADLLTIARGTASARELENLNHLIKEYLSSPEHIRIEQQYSGVTFTTDFPLDLWNIHCSSIHVRKSIMNLISNAAEAIGGEGQIGIVTWNEYIDLANGKRQNLKEGEYVVLSVTDSGSGISDEDMQHIFDPFFSRKQMGPTSGTGLGLTVVWNTAQDHDGAVLVEKSTLGTTFRMYFPATREPLKAHAAPMELKNIYGNGERLLVVDDQDRQRTICRKLLTSFGYKVSGVASGEEALEYLKTHTVDVLVLDMILGHGLTGRQTYSEVIKRFPGQKAIIVSGFSADTEVRKTQRLGAGLFVKKPYTIQQLGMAIKSTLLP